MKTKKKAAKLVTIPAKYVRQVANGIEWLDVTLGRKGWLNRMKMQKFDITDGTTCVAGNVFAEAMGGDGWKNFEDAMELLGLKGTKAGARLGFYSDTDKGYQHLQDLWVMAIKKMKKQAAKK